MFARTKTFVFTKDINSPSQNFGFIQQRKLHLEYLLSNQGLAVKSIFRLIRAVVVTVPPVSSTKRAVLWTCVVSVLEKEGSVPKGQGEIQSGPIVAGSECECVQRGFWWQTGAWALGSTLIRGSSTERETSLMLPYSRRIIETRADLAGLNLAQIAWKGNADQASKVQTTHLFGRKHSQAIILG